VSFRFPPLTFAAYGLGGSWSGRGWVAELRWSSGPEGPAAAGYDQIEAIWLGHGDNLLPVPESNWALVGTFNLDRGVEDIEEVARTDGLFKLTWYLRPALDDGQGFTYSRREYEFAQEAPLAKTWRNVSWTCDGDSVEAVVLDWAGGWIGHPRAFRDLPVVVIAATCDAQDFALSLVRDGARYHFDPDAPIEWPDVVEASEVAAFGTEPSTESRWPHHNDHDQLLMPPLPLPPPEKPYVATSAGVRLVELIPFEDRMSHGWRATTDDDRQLEIRFHRGLLHVRRVPAPHQGDFHPSQTDPRRGVWVYRYTTEDYLYNEPVERHSHDELTLDEMLDATGMILVSPGPEAQ
jgi:hypothetical protein